MARVSIGLEVGTRTVRAIALAAPSRAERSAGQVARIVATAAVTRLTQDGHPKPLPAVLAEVQEMLRVRGTTAVHLADAKVLFRFIATMPLAADRTAKVLRLELASHTAEDGDLAADAWTLSLPGDEVIHGCAVASPTDLYAGMIDLAEGGWKGTRLGSGPVASFNATIPTSPARGDALHLLIDLGPTSTALTLFGEDRLLACRTISLGHEAFAEALRQDTQRIPAARPPRPMAKSLPPAPVFEGELELDGLSLDDTPGLKTRPLSLDLELEDLPPASPVAAAATSSQLDLDHELVLDDGSAPLPESDIGAPGEATLTAAQRELGPEATRIAEQLASQIASSVLWFRQQLKLPSLTLAGIHLAGEGASMEGLDRYLGRRFSCPAQRFRPTDLMAGPTPEDSPAWTCAIGLALPGLGLRHAVALDLRPESLLLQEMRRRHLIGPLVAAGFVVLAAVPLGVTAWREQAATEASLAAWETYAGDHKKLKADLDAVAAEKQALGEDLRAIAGRIAAGENLLLAVRAVKEQSPKSKELWITSMTTDRVVPADGKAKGDTASKTGVTDTAIDRGALLVKTRIKFDAAPTGVERAAFGKAYIQAIETWRPSPEAPLLFDPTKTNYEEFEPEADAGRGGKGEGTAFKLTIKFVFTPTDLAPLTTKRPVKDATTP